MKLFLISQTDHNHYDTYDSAVVAAETEEIAKTIKPSNQAGKPVEFIPENSSMWDRYSAWVNDPKRVTAEYIGEAKEGTKTGVILSSFNAG